MKWPVRKIKLTWRQSLLGMALLFFTATLMGYALRIKQEASKQSNGVSVEQNNKPLTEDFFRRTKLGQTILGYLSCEDFDCREAFQAVGKLGSEAVPALIRVLQHGVPPEIATQLPGNAPTVARIRAIDALGASGDIRALPPLIVALRDTHAITRARAADALGQIGGDKTHVALLPLLQDSDELVRETTAVALSKLKRPEALPALKNAANTEPKTSVRKAIESAIRAIEQH